MDELKVLQLQVNDRPSTSDVSNMMEGISHTFRKYVLSALFLSLRIASSHVCAASLGRSSLW
jgi:hypothetical protein